MPGESGKIGKMGKIGDMGGPVDENYLASVLEQIL